ncbi:MAG: GNAT family N-acetyltransferase [Proteobacteria bacterium]|nr:GNAT family N-acetyltransferase [Pseudomonadota bacterium]
MQFAALPVSDHPAYALRPIEADDLPHWLAYLDLPEVYRHTSWNHPTLEDLEPYAWSPAMRTPANLLRLAIVPRDTNQLVGTIGFHTVVPVHRSAELAYDLAPSFWGRGIAAHMCRLMVAWAHAQANVLRVQATVLESNQASIRVLERSGFEREGMLRCYRLVRGSPGNFYMYSHVLLDAGPPTPDP